MYVLCFLQTWKNEIVTHVPIFFSNHICEISNRPHGLSENWIQLLQVLYTLRFFNIFPPITCNEIVRYFCSFPEEISALITIHKHTRLFRGLRFWSHFAKRNDSSSRKQRYSESTNYVSLWYVTLVFYDDKIATYIYLQFTKFHLFL